MGRAEDLFNRVQREGVAAIVQLIADRALEESFLDFKRSSDDGADRNLSAEDNRNLSKAISGFANSSGGLLVWGVDCRPNKDGQEIPTPHTLKDARAFRSKLEAAISRLSIPAHPGVRCQEVIADAGLDGYVATLIPMADFGPVRAEDKKLRNYYLRAGSSFEVVPHDALAGMFGRPPRPSLALQLIGLPARINQVGNNSVLVLGFKLAIANVGQILAESSFVSIWRGELEQNYVTVNLIENSVYTLRKSMLPSYQFLSNEGTRLVPGGVDDIATVLLQLPTNRAIGCGDGRGHPSNRKFPTIRRGNFLL